MTVLRILNIWFWHHLCQRTDHIINIWKLSSACSICIYSDSTGFITLCTLSQDISASYQSTAAASQAIVYIAVDNHCDRIIIGYIQISVRFRFRLQLEAYISILLGEYSRYLGHFCVLKHAWFHGRFGLLRRFYF